MMNIMRHLLDATLEELRDWLTERGQPGYRAAQVWRWLTGTRAGSFEEMTDLPQPLRQDLSAEWTLWTSRVVAHRRDDDTTEKLLLEWPDGRRIESVLIREGARRTLCLSTQVGCAMGCVFCASGLDGVDRNLTRGEMIEQMLRVTRLLPPDDRLSHIVVMGMGEPLANLENLLGALGEATRREGLGIGARRITISTVGLPPALRRLAALDIPYHLAVSLHAPDDDLRNRLVPVNRRTGLTDILAAADEYFTRTGRRVTYEYVLLAGVNDRPSDALRLVERLRGREALVNVIPFNAVSGLEFRRPSEAAIEAFTGTLTRGGLNVQVRRRKGHAIDAACGQLRRSVEALEPQVVVPMGPAH